MSLLPDTLRSRLQFDRTWLDVTVRTLTTELGSVRFLLSVLGGILLWVLLNVGILGIPAFDPYPFGWLAVVVPVIAMVVSVIVLMSQNRESAIAEIRQQIDFEVNVRTEHEVTKILKMIDAIHKEMGIARVDTELELMKVTTDIADIKDTVEAGIKNEARSGTEPTP